jgi:Flp pilus assembly protein TadB
MAQTKRKRRSKHRGTAAGTIEARGRTGRKPTSGEKKTSGKPKSQQSSAERRVERLNRPPSWRSALNRAAIAAVILVALSVLAFKQPIGTSIGFAGFALILYIPMGYYLDRFLYNRRMRAQGKQ